MSITYSKSRACSFASFILIFVFIGFVSIANANANYTNLHVFSNTTDNGQNPEGSLILSGDNSSFYGMTYSGGENGFGVIFKMKTDDNDYTNLHNFSNDSNNGENPHGSLTLSGSSLYGMTYSGGENNNGVIFKMNTDGSGYTNLHVFAGDDDGKYPNGNLTLSGGVLYGMTLSGGENNLGVIFKMNTDGSDFTNFHDFAGNPNDGSEPYGSLILSGGMLYGMTSSGGTNNTGVVFEINTDGSDYTNLHNFAGGSDGKYPRGSLTLSGGVLYGMTRYGGDNEKGVIFKMNINGSGYEILHNFNGAADNGGSPWGSLIISGESLAGMTMFGGNNRGVIFRIGLDGNDYTNLHVFAGGIDDGLDPYYSDLLEYNGYFYGMTHSGGAAEGGRGVIIKQLIPEPTFFGILFIISGFFFRRRKS